jgi:hypothetical protein
VIFVSIKIQASGLLGGGGGASFSPFSKLLFHA